MHFIYRILVILNSIQKQKTMSVKINLSNLKSGRDIAGFSVDVLMVLLVIVNLLFIIFDWHFGFAFFRKIVESLSPGFYALYSERVHPNFLLYDAIFVSVFITELLMRWAFAIKRKTHDKWFFYPFIHWYDVLGCIPLGAFRWLRILRVISMTIRLHKMGVISLTDTYLYRLGAKWVKIFTEEISDRVVIRILTGIQREIRLDSPVTNRMITEIIKPHQDTLTVWLSHRIKKVTEHNYALYKDDIKNYVKGVIREAIGQNREVNELASIPLIGNQIKAALERSISDVTFNVVNGMIYDLASDRNNKFIEEVTSIVFESMLLQEEDKELNRVTKEVLTSALDIVKQHVELRQWKQREAAYYE